MGTKRLVALAAASGLILLSAQLTAHPVAHIAVGGRGSRSAAVSPTTEQTLPPPVPSPALSSPAATAATAASVPAHVGVTAPPTIAPVTRAPAAPSAAAPAAVTAVVPTTAPAISGTGLWLMGRDGSGLRRLTADEPRATAWSPDDSHIAVAHLSPTLYYPGDCGCIDILTAADGSSRRLVAFADPVSGVALSWSPDGQRIAASVQKWDAAGMSSEVVVFDASTGAATSLGQGDAASWSARGCLGWSFRTVEVWSPGGLVSSLPPVVGSGDFAWSPAGDRYAVPSSDDATPGAVLTYAADGTGRQDLGHLLAQSLAWTGDGRTVLFQARRDLHLWGQPAGGGPASPLPDPSAFAVNGVDDGIVVATGRLTGQRAIVSTTVSDPTQHQLATVASAGDIVSALAWSRDGRWLLAKVVRSG